MFTVTELNSAATTRVEIKLESRVYSPYLPSVDFDGNQLAIIHLPPASSRSTDQSNPVPTIFSLSFPLLSLVSRIYHRTAFRLFLSNLETVRRISPGYSFILPNQHGGEEEEDYIWCSIVIT